ncbi:MAG: hypothetical protein LQ342_003107 [Letrouitia transgressa]|nr:MAG: hypothetical protein LQ342_003107 [Letrouitia transgressa]
MDSSTVSFALPPKLATDVDIKSHIFQPPKSTSSNKLSQFNRPASEQKSSQTVGRKRSRHVSLAQDPTIPLSTKTDNYWTLATDLSSSIESAPLANTKRGFWDHDTSSNQTQKSVNTGSGGYRASTRSTLRRRSHSRRRNSDPDNICSREKTWKVDTGGPVYPRAAEWDGWSQAIYSVFGAAGRAWDFCRASAFRGFYAGGGQSYTISSPTSPKDVGQSILHHATRDQICQRKQDRIPGSFPEEDFIPDYMMQDHTTEARPAKKRRGLTKDYDLWGDRGNSSSSLCSPRKSGISRQSLVSASLRQSPKPRRKNGSPVVRFSPSNHHRSARAWPEWPALSATSRSTPPSPLRESPKDLEVQRHAARVRRRESERDASLNRFNQQLKSMIREGKEALGTRIEVVDKVEAMDDEICAEDSEKENR